jgi:small ligand-binding sensory domain FIST
MNRRPAVGIAVIIQRLGNRDAREIEWVYMPDSGIITASATTTDVGARSAPRDLCAQIRSELGGARADLCLLLGSAHFEDEFDSLAAVVQEQLNPRGFLGATAEGIIAADREYERQPALVLWAASLPRVEIATFHIDQEQLQKAGSAEALRELTGVPAGAPAYFLLLGDPYTIDVLSFLDQLSNAYPGRPAFGGMASAGEIAGQNRLIFAGVTQRRGLVGAAVWGDVRIDSIVSQGCRPIGQHMLITRAEKNIIYELGRKTPLKVVADLLQRAPARDVELMKRRGLLLGRAINEHRPDFGRGDFLIRNPMSFDENTGAMAVNDYVRTGQTVQFHVRDSSTAAEDLASLLSLAREEPCAGALVFTCNGRGTNLFTDRHHDARAVFDACGQQAVAGLFCAGEIGPVAGRNFLHGHTASIAIFRPAGGSADES